LANARPGATFAYRGANTYLISRIIHACLGQDLRDFLLPRLFTPLGIRNPQWLRCPLGYSLGAVGLLLRTEEIARLGRTLLDDGRYGNRQIVPAEYVVAMITDTIPTGAVDAATIRAVVSGCANAWGPEGGYTVEWVQTTLGKLQTLSTGHVSHAATPLVAIQIHAVFTKGGQAGPAETMLIRLFFGGTPSGVEVPVNPVNLAALGVVHRLG